MNIHQADKYNYSNFLRLFSKNKKDDFISNLKNSFSNVSGSYNSNTIEDVLKGTVKNSYGVEGMDITNKKAWKKVIPISESMIKNAVNDVKKSFYEYGGMSGDKKSEHDAYSVKLNSYYKTIDVKDRLAASWTLDQIRLDLAEHVKKEVQAQDSKWKVGQPIDSKVLDKIFAEEKVTSKYKHSAVTGTYKGFNKRV